MSGTHNAAPDNGRPAGDGRCARRNGRFCLRGVLYYTGMPVPRGKDIRVSIGMHVGVTSILGMVGTLAVVLNRL
ncbi:hypothetical protein ACIP5Y_31410 [Nocardia sp. NPDC088792]|uniref:hypothetical protein n=1 Tax=Nocardia sp. NPDC088792 TaxID=3364332 RepID=UPI0037FBFA2C